MRPPSAGREPLLERQRVDARLAHRHEARLIDRAPEVARRRIDAHRARVGRQELAVDAALEAGAGKLFVRPEAVRVSMARPEASNAMLADVLDGVFLGRSYRLALRLEGVPGATIHSIVPPETGDALLGPHAASRCWVELPRHAIRAYA